MNTNKETPSKHQEWLFTAVSVGFCLLLVGFLFAVNPNLFDKILDFLKDFELVDVPHASIVFPAPASPRIHSVVYQAAVQFSIAVTMLQVILLALRFVIPSSLSKKSETVSGLVYWAGASFLIQSFFIDNVPVSTVDWFSFWALIIVLAGVSIIARAAVVAVSRL